MKSQRINETIFSSKFTTEVLEEFPTPEPFFTRDILKDLTHAEMSAKKVKNKSTKHTHANQQAQMIFTPKSSKEIQV